MIVLSISNAAETGDIDCRIAILTGDGVVTLTVDATGVSSTTTTTTSRRVVEIIAATGIRGGRQKRKIALVADKGGERLATHGFGIGEIHLRINAVQLRNSMRAVDGHGVTTTGGNASSRLLIDRFI